MLTDDLGRLEALDALRSGVPAGHIAVGTEHVDGIVDDRLNQQFERILIDSSLTQVCEFLPARLGWRVKAPSE
jgi:hypothetical protein